MAKISLTIDAKTAQGVQKIIKMAQAQDTLEKSTKKAGRAAEEHKKSVDKGFGPAAVGQLKAFTLGLVGGGSVLGAIGAINKAYETTLKNLREISKEAQKAGGEILSFAALQEGGTKAEAVKKASDLAVRFGISDRGEAFNTVQALQSARGGDLEAGLAAAETVFAGSQIGVSVDRGTELEAFGANQGAAPGSFLRSAFIAGQQSSRDPQAISAAAPGLKQFRDKDLGFGVAAVLAGSVEEGELKTAVSSAGRALSKAGKGQELFKKQGLGDASQLERLRFLKKEGIDTPEEIEEFGFSNIRQIDALAGIVPNLDEVERIQGVISEQDKPGLLAKQRRDVESELPNLKTQRNIDTLASRSKDLQAFGPGAAAGLELEESELIRGNALRSLGKEESIFGDLIDEGGKSTPRDTFQGAAGAFFEGFGKGGPAKDVVPLGGIVEAFMELSQFLGDLKTAMEDVKGELESNTKQLEENSKSSEGVTTSNREVASSNTQSVGLGGANSSE